jgi:hypothetical protein
MARKGWLNLSHDRRVKLEKRGVTRASYEAGRPLGERTYSQRRHESLERYGLLPHQVTRLRKDNPQLAREHDRINRLRKSDPDAANLQAREVWRSMTLSQRQQRFRVHFPGGDRDVVNPLVWYH